MARSQNVAPMIPTASLTPATAAPGDGLSDAPGDASEETPYKPEPDGGSRGAGARAPARTPGDPRQLKLLGPTDPDGAVHDGAAPDDAADPSAGGEQAGADAAKGVPLFRTDRMLESLRHAEYDLNHGLGELLDNSVESGARSVWVAHKRQTVGEGKKKTQVVSEVAVVDNGEGMTPEILGRALRLGDSPRPPRVGGGKGIGRFGLGMMLGALSLARRIEVYSRPAPDAPFLFVSLDLSTVTPDQTELPVPVAQDPPAEYKTLLEKSSGTVVRLLDCDRIQHAHENDDKPVPADELVAGLANWIGRTYRKFIAAGVSFTLDGKPVYLHDPLYMMGPTVWDAKGKADPKATDQGTMTIALDVPGEPGRKANVTIRMTLLPLEFRRHRFRGDTGIAKERRIDENEGISILRADREVLYGRVPYLTPKGGQRGTIEVDRFWGCEVSFPPELDPYFEVRYIKRGAQPVPALKKAIKAEIEPVIAQLRKRISAEFEATPEQEERQRSAYTTAEDALAAADRTLPRSQRGKGKTRAQEDSALESAAAESVDVQEAPPEQRTERKKAVKARLAERPYSIVAVKYPQSVLFETVHMVGRTIIKLNTGHPFYTKVFEPLCGSVADMTEDSDVTTGASTPEQRRARDGFMLLLLSYAKAEALFGEEPLDGDKPEQVFEALRSHWGLALGTAIAKAEELG